MKATTNSIRRFLVIVIAAGWLALQASAGLVGASGDLLQRVKCASAVAESGGATSQPMDLAGVSKIAEFYGRLPLSFEVNQGQADSQVKFFSRGTGHTVCLNAEGAVLEFKPPTINSSRLEKHSSTNEIPQWSIVRMRLVGANGGARTVALDELPGKSNYFVGNDPGRWRRSVPTYAKVKYESVYPGVDVVYYGNQRRLEFDFCVAPGADFKAIRMRFDGGRRLRAASNGDLVIDSSSGEIRQHKPVIYQEEKSERREIAGRYVLKSGQDVGFEIGSYDKGKPLIIDPILTYATYLGGPGADDALAVAVDSSGNAYVAGTSSGRFPRAAGGFSNRDPGVFIAKLNPAGTHLLYST
ncbi:MAG: SBBP repeat-containing protein, partial [Blastocatellia bacterium]